MWDLTAEGCRNVNLRIAQASRLPIGNPNDLVIGTTYPIPQPAGVFCQSIGSTLRKARGGRFPLNFTYQIAHRFDGANDGLVGEASFPWGERFQMLTPQGKRGISHGDVVDLNRENIRGFDVREYYVQLVADLKTRGF